MESYPTNIYVFKDWSQKFCFQSAQTTKTNNFTKINYLIWSNLIHNSYYSLWQLRFKWKRPNQSNLEKIYVMAQLNQKLKCQCKNLLNFLIYSNQLIYKFPTFRSFNNDNNNKILYKTNLKKINLLKKLYSSSNDLKCLKQNNKNLKILDLLIHSKQHHRSKFANKKLNYVVLKKQQYFKKLKKKFINQVPSSNISLNKFQCSSNYPNSSYFRNSNFNLCSNCTYHFCEICNFNYEQVRSSETRYTKLENHKYCQYFDKNKQFQHKQQ